jgi:hypothetical protein
LVLSSLTFVFWMAWFVMRIFGWITKSWGGKQYWGWLKGLYHGGDTRDSFTVVKKSIVWLCKMKQQIWLKDLQGDTFRLKVLQW